MSESALVVRLSVIIPVGNRQADPVELYAEYLTGLDALGDSYETIFVLDGSHESFESGLKRLEAGSGRITVVSLTRSFGEATALMAGFEHASGQVIVTLPAYYQIQGSEVKKLVEALDGCDFVTARRWPRAGGPLERLRRSAFHGLLAWVTDLRFSDLGCGARAFDRRVLEEIQLYGDQHRFLAVLAERQGFRVREVDVAQSSKDKFEGYYEPRAYARGFLDIFTVFFLVRFTKKPLRFFGMIGVSMFIVGAFLVGWIVIERLLFDQSLTNRPALLLSTLLVVLGLQLFALGLLGELIIFTHAKQRRNAHFNSEQIMTPDTATFSDFMRVLRNRARQATLAAFVVLLAIACFAFLSPAVYEASATLLIQQMDMPVTLTGGAGAQEYVEQRLQRTRQRVLTDENVKAFIERHKLYESAFEVELVEEKLAKFNESVSITPQVTGVIDPKSMRAADLTYAFDVGFKDSDPETTERVANELAELFVSSSAAQAKEEAEREIVFARTESERLASELREREARLAKFRQAHPVGLPDDRVRNQERALAFERDLANVDADLRAARARMELYNAQLRDTPRDSPVLDQTGQVVLRGTDRLAAAQQELMAARSKYSEDHPDVRRLHCPRRFRADRRSSRPTPRSSSCRRKRIRPASKSRNSRLAAMICLALSQEHRVPSSSRRRSRSNIRIWCGTIR
jgi:glycosyltransferase involved in cell wall biosynthesis